MDEEDRENINPEIRHIALELMKLAKKTKTPFKKIAKEYVQNVFDLQEIVVKTVQEIERKTNKKIIKNTSTKKIKEKR
jgi:hypothetical protein